MMFGDIKYSEINSLLNERFKEKKVLIAQHRGAKCGNVVENTLLAYRVSEMLGADMFEADISISADGVLYCFHDTTEDKNLRVHTNIENFSSAAIDEFGQYNSIWEPSGYKVERFEYLLDNLAGRELFNIDRAWDKFDEVFAVMSKYPSAVRQAILKAPVKDEYLKKFDEHPIKYMFMPIIKSAQDIQIAKQYKNINIVGYELIVRSEDDKLYSDELISQLHSEGAFVWINAITLSGLKKHEMSAGHGDNVSLECGFDKGWGALIDKGIDIIQTDWPELLSQYRDKKFKGGNR